MMRSTRMFRIVGGSASPSGGGARPAVSTSSISTRLCGFVNNWDNLRGCHDICYYFPRYSIESHLPHSALPELTAVKKTLYEGDAAGDSIVTLRAKTRELLSRANDVFNGACNGNLMAQDGAAPSVRPHAVAVAAAMAVTEDPIRSAPVDYKTCVTLAPALRVIAQDSKSHATEEGFDSACTVVAAYTRAMTNQLMRGKWHSTDELARITGVSVQGSSANTLPQPAEVMQAVEALQLSCMNLAKLKSAEQHMNDEDNSDHFDHAKSFRSAYNKLTALAALLQIEHNNDCSAAIDMLAPLLRLKGSNEIEKRLIETLRVEIMRRAYGDAWGKDAVDSEVENSFHFVQDFWAQYFDPAKPEGAVSMEPSKKVAVRDAYSMFLISYGSMYLEMPRMDAEKNQRYPVGARLHLSPFVHVPCAAADPTAVIRLKAKGSCIPCGTERARKLATAIFDRSLRINRKICPERRDNHRSASALRMLAICFADVGDYLYASGMFNSALRTYEALYGKVSEEYIEVLERSQEMQRFLKNDKEAEATGHLITQLKADFEHKNK